MYSATPRLKSHLFTLRLWQEELRAGEWEWRGAIRYVPTGEEHYFRDWKGLRMVMATMLPGNDEEILVTRENSASS